MESPSSPKVFDLSSADDQSFDLFTPRKQRPSSIVPPLQSTGKENQPTVADHMEADFSTNYSGHITDFDVFTPKKPTLKPVADTSVSTNEISPLEALTIGPLPLHIPKETSKNVGRQRDISVPLKDAPGRLPPPPSTPIDRKTSRESRSAPSSNQSARAERGPLSGITAFVDVRTADGDDAGAPFADALKSLGAKVVKQWTWNGEEVDKVGISHVVYKQGGPRTLSKVKWAKGAVKCVGLGWISRYGNI